jgi:hypothetical protein
VFVNNHVRYKRVLLYFDSHRIDTLLFNKDDSFQASAAILAMGYAMIMVSTFGRAQAAAIRNGFNDDLDTYIFVSSQFV